MMATPNNVILAEDIRPFASQVAGHACQTDKRSPGMLKHKDGFVLKPLLKQTQAKTELEFYKGLASSPHAALTPFIAQFHGTAKIDIGSYRGEVIILEDVTGNLEKPCIMDIKIGRQTWDPFASASKIEAEEKKYTECKRELGFCIPGFQVYDSESGKVVKYDKSYGKSLNKSTVLQAFSIFLNLHNRKHATKAIEVYISKLEEISNIISKQKQLHLYSSSILLSYDCEKLGTNVEACEWADVHLIDFAHTFTGESHTEGVDENYLNGLRNLMHLLSQLSAKNKKGIPQVKTALP